jgi:subtilisin family serine protease
MLTASCSSRNQETGNKVPRLINTKLVSDRGVGYVHGVVMLRLQNPPLLTTATKDENGKIIINEEHKNLIINEHQEILKNLKKISDKIQLVYSYKLSFNGVAVLVPAEHFDAVLNVQGTTGSQKRQPFTQIKSEEQLDLKNIKNQFSTITADFIGAKDHAFRGKGIKVAVFDTGIDYTHNMFNGPGTKESFTSVDPAKETSLFPNSKVKGGIDLVGEDFTPWSLHAPNAVPRIDNNPIDTSGHGSHVAGTIAGRGDGVNTHDGIAPEADLYAIKVFGSGGTGDDIVIAGIEWALDPNGDYDLSDKLDVGNMSLGAGYGHSYSYYSEAVKNASEAGFIIVTSAGNSGATPYIVGSPGTTTESVTVGASIGGMEYLWKMNGSRFEFASTSPLIVEQIEGTISTPIKDITPLKGELFFIGEAAEDLSPEMASKLNQKVALIDRGSVSFVDKLKRAKDAGAIGAIVVNNKPNDPAFTMGGEGNIDLPAIMITKEQGDVIKNQMQNDLVHVFLNHGDVVEKKEIIDTITGFSSQGPRLSDGLLKPEIIAPGYQVISAAVGSGNEQARLNGTSMSAPQIAGVMALLKESHPTQETKVLKSLLIGTAKTLKDESGKDYPISRQGSGRVQAGKAIASQIYATPATLSLGHINIVSKKTISRKVTFTNLSDQEKNYDIGFVHSEHVTVASKQSVTIAAKGETSVTFNITITKPTDVTSFKEFDILIKLMEQNEEVLRVPTLGIMKSVSNVEIKELDIQSTSVLDSDGALADLEIHNNSSNPATVELFNLIGFDKRKPHESGLFSYKNRSCDLAAAGYKIVDLNDTPTLQIAVKLHKMINVWDICEVSAQIDTDNDGEVDLELGGILSTGLSGLTELVSEKGHYSVLIDSKQSKEIRLEYEKLVRESEGTTTASTNYKEAVRGIYNMTVYNQSTVSIIEVPLSALNLKNKSLLNMKLATMSYHGENVESDDFFGIEEKWHTITVQEDSQGHVELPTTLSLAPQEKVKVTMRKGAGLHDLMALIPTNLSFGPKIEQNDQQIIIIKPRYVN